ncbi:restless-like transposase [Ilyonectria robusta]
MSIIQATDSGYFVGGTALHSDVHSDVADMSWPATLILPSLLATIVIINVSYTLPCPAVIFGPASAADLYEQYISTDQLHDGEASSDEVIAYWLSRYDSVEDDGES